MWSTERRAKISEACITLAVAALAVGAFFAAQSYRSREAQKAAILQGPRPGSVVHVAGVNWAASRLSLLFVMQVGCHWCEASAGTSASASAISKKPRTARSGCSKTPIPAASSTSPQMPNSPPRLRSADRARSRRRRQPWLVGTLEPASVEAPATQPQKIAALLRK